jgi:hypothetical protein
LKYSLFIDGDCERQEDYYDAAGNYIKTVCTYAKAALTKQAAAVKCDSFNMILADPENHRESFGVLITRANAEYSLNAAAVLWVGGEQNGLCSVIKYKSDYNFEKKWVPCNSGFASYCEFNSEYFCF